MLLTEENTHHLSSADFVVHFSIEVFSEENLYLLDQERINPIPSYFYPAAYILEFQTEFLMSGLTILLSNSSVYNFENALNSFTETGNNRVSECLEAIIATLKNFGLKPTDMRERFVNGTQELPQYSIIKIEPISRCRFRRGISSSRRASLDPN
ncbi:MAG: hypothetical protein IPN95_23165 [Bacteroidetes bacterium]|nr:hypothetical protein [Bacteroidota bacterium]